MKTTKFLRAFIALLFIFGSNLQAQTSTKNSAAESGKFILYKYLQPIGAEAYEIAPDGDSLVLKANFNLTFVGGKVPLETTLRVRNSDYQPVLFTSKGKTSTRTQVDTNISIEKGIAAIRNGSANETKNISGKFFTIHQPAPVSPQMMLFRYWKRNNIKDNLTLLPGGNAKIVFLGNDKITVDGRTETLERYAIEGVMWERENVWFDKNQRLIALVGPDAEMDRLEAVREGYESALVFR